MITAPMHNPFRWQTETGNMDPLPTLRVVGPFIAATLIVATPA